MFKGESGVSDNGGTHIIYIKHTHTHTRTHHKYIDDDIIHEAFSKTTQ